MNQPPRDLVAISHREAWELLPWYVNGALEAPELSQVEVHLASCGRCSSELSVQNHLAHGVRNSEELVFSADRAFQRLDERIDTMERQAAVDERETRAAAAPFRWWASLLGAARPVRLTLAAQALALILLAALALRDAGSSEGGSGSVGAAFKTLSTPAAAVNPEGPALRIVFRTDATESDLRALLLAVEGTIIGGPSPFGVYTISVPHSAVSAIESLRRSPWVTFAEPATREAGG